MGKSVSYFYKWYKTADGEVDRKSLYKTRNQIARRQNALSELDESSQYKTEKDRKYCVEYKTELISPEHMYTPLYSIIFGKASRKNYCDDLLPQNWLAERVFEVGLLQVILERILNSVILSPVSPANPEDPFRTVSLGPEWKGCIVLPQGYALARAAVS